jgi:hypothetical protein
MNIRFMPTHEAKAPAASEVIVLINYLVILFPFAFLRIRFDTPTVMTDE